MGRFAYWLSLFLCGYGLSFVGFWFVGLESFTSLLFVGSALLLNACVFVFVWLVNVVFRFVFGFDSGSWVLSLGVEKSADKVSGFTREEWSAALDGAVEEILSMDGDRLLSELSKCAGEVRSEAGGVCVELTGDELHTLLDALLRRRHEADLQWSSLVPLMEPGLADVARENLEEEMRRLSSLVLKLREYVAKD